MRKFKDQRGFTLVEIAIVLVIIGIILGAVVKGQDLVDTARAKKLSGTINTWNALTWAYSDRFGRLPGDNGRNGIIGDTEITAAASAIGEMVVAGVFGSAPQNPVVAGGSSFWIYFGNVAAAAPGVGTRNVMVICGVANCGTALSSDQVRILQTVDTSIDEDANAGLGAFRGATAAVTLAPAAPTLVNNRMSAVVTAATLQNATPAGATALWTTAHFAGVYFFDRQL